MTEFTDNTLTLDELEELLTGSKQEIGALLGSVQNYSRLLEVEEEIREILITVVGSFDINVEAPQEFQKRGETIEEVISSMSAELIFQDQFG